MTTLRSFHEEHGGEYAEAGGRSVVEHYGRPERTHLAVRNGVGVTEQPYDVVIVSGADRLDYVDNVLSNAIPTTAGTGVYALLLDPQGRVRMDLHVYTAEDRLLLFLPPGRGEELASEWRERMFIQDVSLELATEDYAILHVTGPLATEKLAGMTDTPIPEAPFSFVQATIADAGVTLVSTDDLTGEASYEIVCASYDAEVVMDAMLNRGHNAVPFGRRTWRTLTLEAGTPLLETEFENILPNVTGIRHGIDFEKGCFVGQEVVSRIENRGEPNERLVGLTFDRLPELDVPLVSGDEEVGRITRAASSPSLDRPIGFGIAPYDPGDLTVAGADTTIASFPFVEGSARSLRIPSYPE